MAKKKHNWRIRGKSLSMSVYSGSDFSGKPVIYTNSISDINPKTGRRWTDAQRDRLWERYKAKCDSRDANRSSDITVVAMCEDVLERKIKPTGRIRTVQAYRSIIKRIQATMGEKRATQLATSQVQDWVTYLSEEYVGTAAYMSKEKGLSPKTVHSSYSFLHMCYDAYRKWDLIDVSPCHDITLPPLDNVEKNVYTKDEVDRLMVALADTCPDQQNMKVSVLLGLCCGLREGEISGLDEDDIDFEQSTANVSKTRQRGDDGLVVQRTKTSESSVNVVIPSGLLSEIRTLITYHKKCRLQFGPLWTVQPSLIKNASGKAVNNSQIWKWFNDFLKENGLRHISVHDLRHTYVSMLGSFGLSLVEISHEARHANKSTTLNVYSHLFRTAEDLKREDAKKVDNVVFKNEFMSNSCQDK